MLTIAILCCFAFLAGFIDAMVGGGGLIQLPALFIFQPHLSLVQTLATNKTASFMGTFVAAIQYIKRVKIYWKQLLPIIACTFAASFTGALLVSYIHKEDFMPFVIIALSLVFVYTIFKKEIVIRQAEKQLSGKRFYLYGIGTGLLLGFYEGLIGPGTGSFLIFVFVVLFGYNFLYASANAKIINCVASIGALCLFITQGNVNWKLAIPIGVANMFGSYTGSHVAIKKGSTFVRLFFIMVVGALILKLGYDYRDFYLAK
jgi:uncharacterized membrane protein YfcA